MQNITKYSVFKTKWGYFGLAGNENGLSRAQLPGPEKGKIRALLLKDCPEAKLDKNFCKDLQKQITTYYEGKSVKFSKDIPIDFNRLTSFGKSVLKICRKIENGQTATYSQLAKKAGRPNASRAVGSILAKNPMPLIIPCHRIIRSDGKMGGFSAPGGIATKKKMLELECKANEF
jgi:O-6-methylguanine DNA methyltransferase